MGRPVTLTSPRLECGVSLRGLAAGGVKSFCRCCFCVIVRQAGSCNRQTAMAKGPNVIHFTVGHWPLSHVNACIISDGSLFFSLIFLKVFLFP